MQVRRSDMDMNQHVNNVTYLKWATEDLPSDLYSSHVLTGVDIEYRAEGHFGAYRSPPERNRSKCACRGEEVRTMPAAESLAAARQP